MPVNRFGTGQYESSTTEAVKDGRMFRSFVSGTIAAGATKTLLMKTPTLQDTRVTVRDLLVASSDSPLAMTTITAMTVTNDGTPLSSYNFDLTSSRLSQSQFFEDPVYTGGIIIDKDLVPSGAQSGQNIQVGSRIASRFPQIGPSNSSFALELANIGTQVATYIFKIVWEEVP